MSRGPLPGENTRRRNAPTIPTTSLPASGRKGELPDPPDDYEFRTAGWKFWNWAWSTPQAAAWDDGALYAVARRAQLEDDLAVLDRFDDFNLADLLGMPQDETIRELEFVIGRLKSMASGRLQVVAKMNDLDKRLGLDPKAMAELRWKVVDDTEKKTEPSAPAPAPGKLPDNVRRIRAQDPAAVA